MPTGLLASRADCSSVGICIDRRTFRWVLCTECRLFCFTNVCTCVNVQKNSYICNMSAPLGSQILLLSTATTSSWLNSSDQLQKSAAIFSKTWRVAVYLETHCNIGSKRAFPVGVLGRWHSCLLIYWRTSCLVPAFDNWLIDLLGLTLTIPN